MVRAHHDACVTDLKTDIRYKDGIREGGAGNGNDQENKITVLLTVKDGLKL